MVTLVSTISTTDAGDSLLAGTSGLQKIGSTLYFQAWNSNPVPLFYSTDEGATWSSISHGVYEPNSLFPLGSGVAVWGEDSTGDSYLLAFSSDNPPTSFTTETAATGVGGDSGYGSRSANGAGVRSNGEVVALEDGPPTSSMGSNYDRVYYQRRTGTNTWTAQSMVSATDNNNYVGVGCIVVGTRAHFVLISNSTLITRTLSPTNALSTATVGAAVSVTAISNAIVDNSGWAYYGWRAGSTQINVNRYDSTLDSPSVSSEVALLLSSGTVLGTPVLAYDSATDTTYMLWASGSSLYLQSRVGISDPWSSAVTLYSGTGNAYMHAALVITKSGGSKVIGIVARTDGASAGYKYFEEPIVGAPGTPTTAPTVSAGVDKVTVTTPALATSADATSWNIYRDGTLVASAVAGSAAYDDTAASITATQTYTVRGANLSGTSTDSPASAAVVADPGVTTFSLSVVAANTVRVSITRKAYSAVYKVYRASGGGVRTLVHTSSLQVAGGTYTWDDTSATDLSTWDYSVIVHADTPTSRDGAESSVQTVTPNLWSTETSFTTGREIAVAFPLGGGLFYMGAGFGGTYPNQNWLDTAYTYNTSTNTWTAKNATTTISQFDSRNLAWSGDGTGWAIKSSGPIYKYNTSTDAWDLQAITNPNTTGAGESYTFIGTTVYMHTKPTSSKVGWGSFYKLTGGTTWTVLTKANGTYASSDDDPWWICAGDDGYIYGPVAKGASATVDEMQRYDPATDTWTVLSSTPPYHYQSGGPWVSNPINWSGKIYCLGIQSDTSGGFDTTQTVLWSYDYYTDTWTLVSKDMPTDNGSGYYYEGISGVLVDSEPAIYWLGGQNSQLSQWTSANRRQQLPAYTAPPQNYSGSASLSGSGTLTGSGVAQGPTGSISLSGAGTVALAGAPKPIQTQALSGSGTLALAGKPGLTTSVAFSGGSQLLLVAAVELLPPANLTATPISSTRIDLSWTAATNATGYDIERNGAVIVNNQPGTTYSDTGLTQGSAYTYRVRSVKIVAG